MTLRPIQGHCPNIQKSDKECQSPSGDEFGDGHEGQQERRLSVDWQ